MKRAFFCLFVIISIAGCKKEESLIQSESYKNKMAHAVTRSIVETSTESETNPTLISDWENIGTVKLNSSSIVTVPWVTGASTALSGVFCKDIKKEDGWMMLFHTFKRANLDTGQNYMCFYNMFTGYLKFFYYYEGDNQNQGTQWYVKTSNGSTSKLFGLGGYFSLPSAATPYSDMIIVANMTQDNSKGLTHGWNGFEFEVPYCSYDGDLIIGAYNRNITSYEITGIADLSTIGTITTKGRGLGTVFDTVVGLAGNSASGGINGIIKDAKLGSFLTGLISFSPANYVSVLSLGLNAIFGKTTKTVSDVKLTTSGKITFSGTSFSEATSGVPPLTINLCDIMKHSAQDSEGYIGVWTLADAPRVTYSRSAKLTDWRVTATSESYTNAKSYHIEGHTTTPNVYLTNYHARINNKLNAYLISSQCSYRLLRCDRLNGQAYKKEIVDFSDFVSSSASLFYENDDIRLFEYKPTKVSIGGYVNKDPYNVHEFYYDWGNIDCGRLIAVVSVTNKFNYKGKIIDVEQSRCYETKYFVDIANVEDVDYYNMYPYNCTINYGEPYYDLYKRMHGLPVIDYSE